MHAAVWQSCSAQYPGVSVSQVSLTHTHTGHWPLGTTYRVRSPPTTTVRHHRHRKPPLDHSDQGLLKYFNHVNFFNISVTIIYQIVGPSLWSWLTGLWVGRLTSNPLGGSPRPLVWLPLCSCYNDHIYWWPHLSYLAPDNAADFSKCTLRILLLNYLPDFPGVNNVATYLSLHWILSLELMVTHDWTGYTTSQAWHRNLLCMTCLLDPKQCKTKTINKTITEPVNHLLVTIPWRPENKIHTGISIHCYYVKSLYH